MDLSRIAANQQRTFLALWAGVRPYVRGESALPRRIKDLLGRNRALGARDRRLYRELIYTTIRFLPWVEARFEKEPATAARIVAWLAPELPSTSPYRAVHCGDWPAAPETLAEKAKVLTALIASPQTSRASPPDEPTSEPAARPEDSPGPFEPQALLPAWFRDHCPAAFDPPHLEALNERARLWVRLQCKERSVVIGEFLARGWSVRPEPDLPDAVSLPPNAEVATTDAWRRGFVEIQDLGSQLVLQHAPVDTGQIWLDACAGAGGKTLQLARLVGDQGRVDAGDIRAAALDELRDRTARAKLANVHLGRTPGVAYDGVLVDAPCSGTGTWRRLPHMKWYTQPGMIDQFAATQLAILSENAAFVRSGGDKCASLGGDRCGSVGGDKCGSLGGLLVYATCSLSHRENHDVVAAFLKTHPEFSPEPPVRDWGTVPDGLGHTLLPGTRDSDGFYVALLRRRN